LLVSLVDQDSLVIHLILVSPVRVVLVDIQVLLDSQDTHLILDSQVNQVFLVTVVHQALVDIQARLVFLVSLDIAVPLDFLVIHRHPVLVDTVVHLVSQDTVVHLDFLDIQDHRVYQASVDIHLHQALAV
jgi:hypothetical protein